MDLLWLVVECLPSLYKSLGPNPRNTKWDTINKEARKKINTKGLWDEPATKDMQCPAWQPKFDLWDSHDEEKK